MLVMCEVKCPYCGKSFEWVSGAGAETGLMYCEDESYRDDSFGCGSRFAYDFSGKRYLVGETSKLSFD